MTLEELHLSIKRAIAMQASLMRVGIHSTRLFVGPAARGDETIVAVYVDRANKKGERVAFVAGPWAGTDEEMHAAWKEACALWNRTSQAVRDAFWHVYRPSGLWLAQELAVAGLLPEPRMS